MTNDRTPSLENGSDGDNAGKEEACTADSNSLSQQSLLYLDVDPGTVFSDCCREELQREELPSDFAHGSVEKNPVHNYLDRIFNHVTQYHAFPCAVRGHAPITYHVKGLLRYHKHQCEYCRLRVHKATGKTSHLVMVMSLVMMHMQTWPGAAILLPILETMYENWANDIDEMKPSECKNTLLRKRERYNKVLEHNRRM